MLLRGKHYATGQGLDITCRDGRIVSIEANGQGSKSEPALEAGWVAPALFDVQINGCDGRSFNSAELAVEDIRHVVAVCRRHGIAALCPTLVTNDFASLVHGLSVIRTAREQDRELTRAMPAIHLEGPYLSPEDGPRGAHPLQHIRPPDWEEFQRLQEAAGGLIRLVTLAPEHDGALEFIEKLTRAGLVVALGHTAASAQRLREAIAAGARLSTHLGNGSHAFLPRHDNYVWEQLAADELWASIICDGHHLPPAVVRCLVRVKTPARLLLTCDASVLAGLPAGCYRQWQQDFEVLPSGKIVVRGTEFLAGSGTFTDCCVGNVMRFAGVSLAEAIDMASVRPRSLLGLPPARLAVNEAAELMLFDWEAGKDVTIRGVLLGNDWHPA